MRNVNTMGKLAYVWENVYWSFLVLLLYRNIFFIPMFSLGYGKSFLLLIGSVIVGVIIGVLLTRKHRRNYVSVACNVILAYGIYYTASLWLIDRSLLIHSATAAAILAASYAVLVVSTYLIERVRRNTGVSIWKCLSSCLLNCRTLVAFVLVSCLVISVVKPLLGDPVLGNQEDIVTFGTGEIQSEGETISENMETILLLEEDSWTRMDAAERLDVLTVIADIETNYLGIPKVAVCTEVLDEQTLGHYNDSTRAITLNLSYLATANARTMLSTVCHECYHAYQHRLVELYNELDPEDQDLLLFYETAQYRDEFENYIDGSDNYYAYSRQWCEADSEQYAEDAVTDYYYRIEQYNHQHQS